MIKINVTENENTSSVCKSKNENGNRETLSQNDFIHFRQDVSITLN